METAITTDTHPMPVCHVLDDVKKQNITVHPKVLTEDFGKTFEMAICLLYGIEYAGNYKYSMEEANRIKDKIGKLKTVFPCPIKHIAQNRNRYDFVNEQTNQYLSAKTNKNKNNTKICPQVIGQPTKKSFCTHFRLDISHDLTYIKNYIVSNILYLLNEYCVHTFDCPIVYYNKPKNKLLYIRLKEPIVWTNLHPTFTHIVKNKIWNESSSVFIHNVPVGEFQIHNKRDCIKFRWILENLLDTFHEHFEIVDISS